jgi:hypothetical protein
VRMRDEELRSRFMADAGGLGAEGADTAV